MIEQELASCFWHSLALEKKKGIISRIIEPVIYRLRGDYRFAYYIKDNDYTKLVIHIVRKVYYNPMIEFLKEYELINTFLINMEFELAEYVNSLTDEDFSIISKINDEIERQIINYDNHNELVETKGTVIMWSNGCRCWNIAHLIGITKGKELSLDAKSVLLPFTKNKVSKYLCLLNESPLYKFSFEAGQKRGQLVTTLEYLQKWTETEEYKKMKEKYA